jgi:hypothetical protein
MSNRFAVNNICGLKPTRIVQASNDDICFVGQRSSIVRQSSYVSVQFLGKQYVLTIPFSFPTNVSVRVDGTLYLKSDRQYRLEKFYETWRTKESSYTLRSLAPNCLGVRCQRKLYRNGRLVAGWCFNKHGWSARGVVNIDEKFLIDVWLIVYGSLNT